MYSKDEIEGSERSENLSPTYFRASKIAESFYNQMDSQEFKDITKKCSEMFYDALNSNIVNWLISDTTNNLATAIQQAVDDEIENLLTGKDQLFKYTYSSKAAYVREQIFTIYGDKLRNDRIKDLENQVKVLRGARY